jgi:acyltransferase
MKLSNCINKSSKAKQNLFVKTSKKNFIISVVVSLIFFSISFIYFIFVYNNDQANPFYKSKESWSSNLTIVTQKELWANHILQKNKDLLAGEKINESFIAKTDSLGIIAVPFNAHNKSIDDKIIFRLKETGKKDWYIQNTYNANQFQTDIPFPFGFPIIEDSKNKSYTFQIESLKGRSGDSLSLSKVNKNYFTEYNFKKSELIRNPIRLLKFIFYKISSKSPFLTKEQILSIAIFSLSPLIYYFIYKSLSVNVEKTYSQRTKWIDCGKGVGILFVILGHFVAPYLPLFTWIFSFHMPLFFFLSGYVSNITKNAGKGSLRKILVTLIVPYFIFAFIGLLISLVIPWWRPTSFKEVIYEIFYNVAPEGLHVGQIWFLFCLAVVEVFFLLFLKLKIRNKYIILGCIVLSAIIANIVDKYDVGLWFQGEYKRFPWKIDTAFMGFFFFSLGYYSKVIKLFSIIFQKRIFLNIMSAIALFAVSVYFGAYLNGNVFLSNNIYGNFIYFTIASLSGILLMIYLSKLLEENAFLLYIGRNTLSIFSSHSFLVFGYASLLSGIAGKNFIIMNNIPLYLCFAGLISVAFVSLIISVIYNNTIQKLILRIK